MLNVEVWGAKFDIRWLELTSLRRLTFEQRSGDDVVVNHVAMCEKNMPDHKER